MFKYFGGKKSIFSNWSRRNFCNDRIKDLLSAWGFFRGSLTPWHVVCPHGVHGPRGSLPHCIFLVRSYSNYFYFTVYWFSTGGDSVLLSTCCQVWIHFWLSWLHRCYWHLVGGETRDAANPSPPCTGQPYNRKWSSPQCQLCCHWETCYSRTKGLLRSQALCQRGPASLQHSRELNPGLNNCSVSLCLPCGTCNVSNSAGSVWKSWTFGRLEAPDIRGAGPSCRHCETRIQECWAAYLGEFLHDLMLFKFPQTSPQLPTLWPLTVIFKSGLGSGRSPGTEVRWTSFWPLDGSSPPQCISLPAQLNSFIPYFSPEFEQKDETGGKNGETERRHLEVI